MDHKLERCSLDLGCFPPPTQAALINRSHRVQPCSQQRTGGSKARDIPKQGENALGAMRRCAAAIWLFVVLFCTDARALQAPALRRSVTVATKSHHSGMAGPVAMRTSSSVAMISPGWRIAAVTTGASSVVSTVVAVREWRGRRRALRQVDDLNATVLSLNTGLQLAAKRQADTDAALSQVRARGEAARVYGLQMADALEREQTARRGELIFKAKEARELAAANFQRQRELQAEILL